MKTTPGDLLTHPDVVRAIVNVVRAGGVPAQDIADAISTVQLKVLHSLRNKPLLLWPKDVENWKALAIRASKTFLFDRSKRGKSRKEAGDEGAIVEEPDSHAAAGRRLSERDPVDHKVAMQLVKETLAEGREPELDFEVLEALLAGEDAAETAARLGLPHDKIRHRLRVIRATFRAKVSALGAGALALLLFFGLRGPGEPRYYAEAPVALVRDATPTEEAAEIRAEAEPFCRQKDWEKCMARLDDAADLDGEGEHAPSVQAFRQQYDDAMEEQMREREAKEAPMAPKLPPKAPKHP